MIEKREVLISCTHNDDGMQKGLGTQPGIVDDSRGGRGIRSANLANSFMVKPTEDTMDNCWRGNND